VSGSGERNNIISSFSLDPSASTLTATFTSGDNRKPAASMHTGGPYAIGAYMTMLVLAEDGDDADCNDTILEIKGYAPR
jgi:hypothetical protein